MRSRVVASPPCSLERAELRRVPQNRKSWVIGYHICCPRCGFVTLALNNQDGLTIDESVTGEVSFSMPVRCLYCSVLIHIERCEFTLEEDDHVRSVCYR